MRRIGCLVVLLILVAAAWVFRDRWLPLIGQRPRAAPAAADGSLWEPLTPAGAARGRKAVETLGQRSGPVYASVGAGDLASYIFVALAKQLPPSAQGAQAAIIDDRLYLKALVNLRDLGGAQALGPLATFLGDRDTVQFGGNFDIIRPGLAQFHVRDIKLAKLSVPRQMIPRILAQIERGARPEGVAADALPLEIPRYVGDVRVANRRVTLYKSVP